MISYTTRYINIVSLIITTIIFLFLNNAILKKQEKLKPTFIYNYFKKNFIQVEINSNSIKKETKEEKYENDQPSLDTKDWKIIIPIIELEAQVKQGTTQEVMNEYVGHFEETSNLNGNVGLAAHNRGYKNNYFSNVKNLKGGDEIIYRYNGIERKYIVQKNIIIKDTDWSYLKETNESKITLITCMENEPEYRRCVQGIEKKED